jgi:hypothetical protein
MGNFQGWAFGSTLLLFTLCQGCQSAPQPDDLIVPGVRVGQVNRDSTEASLRAIFGEKAVTKLIPGDDLSEEKYVTILFENDASRKLMVVWEERSATHLRYVDVCTGYRPTTPCGWHTADGIRMGLTLRELEEQNSRPFWVSSWNTDFAPGLVDSWEGGLLAKDLDGVEISLCLPQGEFPDELYRINTWPAPSNNPILQRHNPAVCEIAVSFDSK